VETIDNLNRNDQRACAAVSSERSRRAEILAEIFYQKIHFHLDPELSRKSKEIGMLCADFAGHECFVNLFGRASKFSVKDGKSNLRGRSLTDRSRHSSFHFISLGFSLERRKEERKEGRKKGRSVVPARSLQLLVGTTFLICWAIPKAFL
jgi:hypothetical protein